MPQGYGLFIGPKEKSGRRKPGESLREMREREAQEALKKKNNKKKDRTAGKAQSTSSPARAVNETATSVRTPATVIPDAQGNLAGMEIQRDRGLIRAVKTLDEESDEHAEALLDLEARLEAVEAVQTAQIEEVDANLSFLGTGLGGILAWLDPFVAAVNAADVPTIPILAQAAALMRATGGRMDGSLLFGGLGKDAAMLIAFLLDVIAHYDPAEGFISVFTADGGGFIAAPTTTTTTADTGGFG